MKKLVLCPDVNTFPDMTLGDNGSCDEMIWEDGLIIDPAEYDLSRLEFICENSGVMTDYSVTDMGCSIESERLKTFFENNGVDNI